MKYELAIFDMDGTILDTIEDLVQAVNFALSECGFEKRTTDEVTRFLGNGARRLIERSVPTGTDKDLTDKVQEIYNEYYASNCGNLTKPYDGIPEVIAELRNKGIKTAVVSNKPDYGVQTLCEQFFDGWFDYVSGAKDGIRVKPFPDMVEKVLDVLGTDRGKTVYVGDSEVDVETARNSGIRCISVDWGFRSRETLIEAGAQTIVSDADTLLRELTE